MAFHEVEHGGGHRPAFKNKAQIWVSGTGVAGLTFSGDVYEQIGSPTHVRVLIGTDRDSGFVALIPASGAAHNVYTVRRASPYSQLRKIQITAAKVGVVPDKRKTTAIPFEVTKDGLIVDLRSIRPVVNRPTSTLIKRETLVAAE